MCYFIELSFGTNAHATILPYFSSVCAQRDVETLLLCSGPVWWGGRGRHREGVKWPLRCYFASRALWD